ncbi:MAG TPA: hypothetical protein VG796_14125 [Verrucomicrobiales bacterium]|nr:hypothetical protein [Verrucomicrobiales bacterium]
MVLARGATLFSTVVVCAWSASAATLIEEGFESGMPGAPWETSVSAEGRVTATTEFQPATGTKHLVLDDTTTNEVYSAAHLTLRLDLSQKKDVQLSFKARSLGNEPHPPPAGSYTTHLYDTVSYSVTGGKSWRSIRSLATLGTETESISVSLDPILTAAGDAYNDAFLIRFTNYDNGSAPADGIAIDDIKVEAEPDQRVSLELPASVVEGSGPHDGFVILRFARDKDLVVQLASSPAGALLLPATVTVPSGLSVAPFTFSVPDDQAVNFTRVVNVNATAAGAASSPALITVTDNEPKPAVSLVLPASITEGSTPANNASIAVSPPAVVPITFTLFAVPPAQVTIPSSVTLPAGQTSVAFTIRAIDDTALDGDPSVTITAQSPQTGTVTGPVTAIDNEQPALNIGFPAALVEGQPGTATIAINAVKSTDTVVNLAVSPPGTVTFPATVTIPARSTLTSVTLTPVNDVIVNLTRTFSLSASGTRLTGATRTGTITDDELPPVLRLTVPPNLREGETPVNTAAVSLSFPLTFPISVQVTGNPASEIVAPAPVAILAGAVSVPFSLRAVDDDLIDGPKTVTLSASATGLGSASAITTTVDNESRTLTLTGSDKLTEGGMGYFRVFIPGKLTLPLQVTLVSLDSATAALPASVTIPAGTTEVFFSISVPDNVLRDGKRLARFRATAAGFTESALSIPVFDNDIAGYRVSLPYDVLIAGREVWGVTVSALDADGLVLADYRGTFGLHVVRPDGSIFPVVPSASIGSLGNWNGRFTLPAGEVAGVRGPVKIRAVDDADYQGDSVEKDVAVSLGFAAQDLVFDKTRGRIYGSVAAATDSPYANKVAVIDPVQRTVVGEIPSHQDPGPLAMSAEDRYLYVAQNGNRTVGKADPNQLTITSSFTIGTDPIQGLLRPWAVACPDDDPEVVVVARGIQVVPPRVTIGVFDGGIMRPVTVEGGSLLEASSDPSVFFSNQEISGAHLTRHIITESGIESFTPAYSPFSGGASFKASGHSLVSANGFIADDETLAQTGALPVVGSSAMCAEPGGRVFFVEKKDINANSRDRIRSYDIASRLPMGELVFPESLDASRGMIRWGENGIAIRTLNDTLLLESRKLVPSATPVDLQMNFRPERTAVPSGTPVRYLLEVVNAGAVAATNIRLETAFSSGQQLSSVTASSGILTSTGQSWFLTVPSLAAGAKIELTAEAVPAAPGIVYATARVSSASPDTAFEDNLRAAIVTTGFNPSMGVPNRLNLRAKNLLYDTSRDRLWAVLHESLPAPLCNALVSIDPVTGIITLDTRLDAYIFPGIFELSSNGRYLYAAISGYVFRVDLASSPRSITRIPLPVSAQGYAQQVGALATLEGDGTSFVVVGLYNNHVIAFDGAVARPRALQNSYSVTRIARYAPNRFTGFNGNSGGNAFDLLITGEGVTVGTVTPGILYGTAIAGGAGHVLSSSGDLIDGASHTLVGTLPDGFPLIDAEHRRACSLGQDGLLRAYNLDDASAQGSIKMTDPDLGSDFSLVREGLDGFAVIDRDGSIVLVRWSGTIPPGKDSDNDHLPDAWEAAHFRTLLVGATEDTDGDGLAAGLEWAFATSPAQSDPSPVGIVLAGPAQLRLTHPVRKGLQGQSLSYQLSENLVEWTNVTPLSSEVTGTRVVDGAEVEDVVVSLPVGMDKSRYARVAWWSGGPP